MAWSLMGCGGNPDANSGGDAYRNQAQLIPMDEWAAGDLNPDEGDSTDWHAVELDNSGKLNVEFRADEKDIDVRVAVFDRYGYSLGEARRKSGSQEIVKISAKAKRDGRHFIQIRASGGVASAYSVRATLGESADAGEPVPDF